MSQEAGASGNNTEKEPQKPHLKLEIEVEFPGVFQKKSGGISMGLGYWPQDSQGSLLWVIKVIMGDFSVNLINCNDDKILLSERSKPNKLSEAT